MSSWLWGTPETDISYEEISTPTTDEEIKAVGEAAIKELLQAFSTDEGWTEFPFTEVGGEDIRLFDKPDDPGAVMPVKSRATINAPLEKVSELVGQVDLAKLQSTVDPDIIALEKLRDFGDGMYVLYSAFSVGPMISAREFVYVQVTRDLPDGSRVIATKSINYPGKKQAPNQIRYQLCRTPRT